MLLVLPRMLRKPALRDHTHALGEGTGAMLGQITPHRAAEEQRIPIDPLIRLPVERARSGRDREPSHAPTVLRRPQLRIRSQIAHHRDDRLTSH